MILFSDSADTVTSQDIDLSFWIIILWYSATTYSASHLSDSFRLIIFEVYDILEGSRETPMTFRFRGLCYMNLFLSE